MSAYSAPPPARPHAAPSGPPVTAPPPNGAQVRNAPPPPAQPLTRPTTEQTVRTSDISLVEALEAMLALEASDLHLTVGAPPTVRVSGNLRPLPGAAKLDGPSLQRVLYAMLTQQQREVFEEDLELDFSYALPGKARFRVNMYKQRESVGAAFRMIPFEIKSLEDLGIPPVVSEFANLPRGFVLVTGPTGSGKSTTLASLIDIANTRRHDHIMTVEDPIEFLHRHRNCLVNQREVGTDTHSFAEALKHVLRQDPDIILVGEMRDLETIQVALTAAETGHLVFATLHTQDAAQTIDRVIDVFPPHQQQQIRQQLAGTIQGIVCQTLCKRQNERGRVVAAEVLVATPAIRNLIREGKTHQIYSAMQAGAQFGMQTLDQNLAELVRTNAISFEEGMEKCQHLEDFMRLTGRTR
ncbi:MAG: type IV pilus twitching motility protein PilT [Actinobacteria bacterium]|nr:type IV pilus twitching motility protein PilT [Actinomycetota bacterium]MCB8995918.1 type IV pilus twitching motility protein PilT [Actinomycetota bacterium]MCB9415123.1 type IV pilus twitching motility protein PilT [Actinomycetota bacterium]